jgi:hypothetical protein
VSNDLNQSAPTLFFSSSSLMFLYFIGLYPSVFGRFTIGANVLALGEGGDFYHKC